MEAVALKLSYSTCTSSWVNVARIVPDEDDEDQENGIVDQNPEEIEQ